MCFIYNSAFIVFFLFLNEKNLKREQKSRVIIIYTRIEFNLCYFFSCAGATTATAAAAVTV